MFRLVGSDGAVREVEYTAKGNAMPERHVLALRDNTKKVPGAARAIEDPAWVQDYALFLFDADGRVAGCPVSLHSNRLLVSRLLRLYPRLLEGRCRRIFD